MHRDRRLYLDNSATSFPKPPSVIEAMRRYAEELGASPGRGAYREVREAGALLEGARALVCRLIGGAAPERVVFTLNCSDALNLAIRGVVEPGLRAGPAHVVTTWMDHNSVLRPLNELAARWGDRLAQTRVAADPATGLVEPAAIRDAIRADTRLVAVAHASNVSGTLQPVAEIAAVCRAAGVPLVVDAAQSLGHVPIDAGALGIDLLAFPGHKGLLGPLGTGALYLAPGMEEVVETVREGGTGSVSERDTQPQTLPEKYEPGSHNAIGLVGLAEGVRWLLERGMEDVWAHERRLMAAFLDGLRADGGALPPGLRLVGPAGGGGSGGRVQRDARGRGAGRGGG